MKCFVVYITTSSDEEAADIAGKMVESRLAACGNVLPGMKSVYQWKGNIEQDNETVLILKTAEDKLDALTDEVKKLHSYEVPCIVALPIETGNADYLDWIVEETR